MNYLSVIKITLLILLLIQSQDSLATQHPSRLTQFFELNQEKSCPIGFDTSRFDFLCIASYLTGDIIQGSRNNDQCAESFYRVDGLRQYCVFDNINLHIEVKGQLVLISQPSTEHCIKGFRKYKKSKSICLNNHSAILVSNDGLNLISQVDYYYLLCELDDTESNVGEKRLCDTNLSHDNIFADPGIAGCLFGFIYSAINDACLPYSVTNISDITQYGLEAPTDCSAFWHRGSSTQMCRPKLSLQICGEQWLCNNYDGDTNVVSGEFIDCGPGLIPGLITIPTKSPQPSSKLPYEPMEPVIMVQMYTCAPPDKTVDPGSGSTN